MGLRRPERIVLDRSLLVDLTECRTLCEQLRSRRAPPPSRAPAGGFGLTRRNVGPWLAPRMDSSYAIGPAIAAPMRPAGVQ